MAYSTEAQLTNNVKILEKTFTGATLTAFALDRITLADKIVTAECANIIDFSDVPDDDTTPVINLLSQYKSAEMSLRRVAGIKRRQNENDDISEWTRLYEQLKADIAMGKVPVVLADGTSVKKSVSTFRNTAKPEIRPNQGYDLNGEWLNNEDMLEIRGDVDEKKYT